MLRTNGLEIANWKITDALQSLRSLLYPATIEAPHNCALKFPRHHMFGRNTPIWITKPGPVYAHTVYIAHTVKDIIIQYGAVKPLRLILLEVILTNQFVSLFKQKTKIFVYQNLTNYFFILS